MKKCLFILIFLAALFALISFAAAKDLCRTPSGKPCVLVEQAAVAQAQGLEFLGINYSTNIGDVLAGVYRFALGLVGISALIMLVFGGVVYMTAADSQDRVKQGQTFMRNAIFGLVLALLSYLILYTINPDIVQRLELDLVKIKEAEVKIEKIPLYDVELSENLPEASQQMEARRKYLEQQGLTKGQAGAIAEGELEVNNSCRYSNEKQQKACQQGVLTLYNESRDKIAECLALYFNNNAPSRDMESCRRTKGVSLEDMRGKITEYKIKYVKNIQ